MQGTKLRYRLTLASGMVECLCFAGAVFGFASLVFVLKEDGYFSQGCVNVPGTNGTLNSTDCSSQDERFSLVFTIASFLNSISALVSGYLFDRFGTMVTRLLGICMYTTGTLLVAFSSAAFSELIFPALSCISVGGILLLLTNMQVGNLFAAHRSTIITLYNGAFDSSAAMFFIIKYFTFVLQVLNRSFLYGGNAAFISIAFPACHFGKLYGLVISMAAVFALLQYPCFALVKGPLGGDPFFVDIALVLLTLLVFIHPVFIFIHCRKLARNRADNSQSDATNCSIVSVAKL